MQVRSFSSLQFANSYCYVLKQVSQNPNLALKDICIITEEEKELLEGLNTFQTGIDLFQSFQDLFEAQVLKTPDQIAVVCNDQSLTYRELNKKGINWLLFFKVKVFQKKVLLALW